MASKSLDYTVKKLVDFVDEKCKGDCDKCKLDFCVVDVLHFLQDYQKLLEMMDSAKNGGEWR